MRPPTRDEDRAIAKRFGEEYFDGPRTQGYGGYRYNPRYWMPVAEDLRDAYGITAGTKVLEIGCAKGFLLHDLRQVVPGVEVYGLDISAYGVQHSMDDVRPHLVRGTAERLPYPDDAFDVVLCINTLHNLPVEPCKQAVRQIVRVTRPGGHSYIQVDSWLTEQQHQDFLNWQLTAQTFFDPEGWRRLFAEVGYDGDYYWTLTE
jgi:ubiquinone/menaquinone biosynthesis C-methylase UbiE